ncbi:MAG: MBL fold metallo-hydrolase [Verrucomicrobia bacterium]|nr:MAG: MBL fold metallo-hydrolase [Verrucomicrobiota bacterium]
MEIIFLGTGTSEGVPGIINDNPILDLSNSKNWRTRSSIHVVINNFHIQVDAAQEFRLQCIANHVTQVDLFILTHGHADHILGMDDLRRFSIDHPLTVYSSPDGLERIKAVFPYAITPERKSKFYPSFNLNLMPSTLPIPGGLIHSTPLPHGNVQTLGLIFEESASKKRVAYFPDCKSIPPEATALAQKADLLIIDAIRETDPHPTHMTFPEALEAAGKINASQTILTHTTSSVDYATSQSKLPPNTLIAYDGLHMHL